MPIVKSYSRKAIASRTIQANSARLPYFTRFSGKKIGRPFLGSAIKGIAGVGI